jgi:large subunit ribosomal protein L6
MSRIGKRPIEVPSGVTVQLEPGRVAVVGPLGSLQQEIPLRMQIAQDDGVVTVTRPTERGEDRALHGLTRTLIANMVEGVTKGFEKRLEIQGVGYRAALKGTDKQVVGQTAAEIRKVRPPEPYKGKGIRYEGEYVRRKVGKRA